MSVNISKLPIRQVTTVIFKITFACISKLPIRQVTTSFYALP